MEFRIGEVVCVDGEDGMIVAIAYGNKPIMYFVEFCSHMDWLELTEENKIWD